MRSRPRVLAAFAVAVGTMLVVGPGLVGIDSPPVVAQAPATTVDVGFSRVPTRYLALKQWKLHDATIFGDVHVFPVFGGSPRAVKKVQYWIDSARPSAPREKPNFTSTVAPYDMAGTAPNREARPWSTTALSDQAFHSVTMRVIYADSTKTTVVARPFVSNAYRTVNGQTLAEVLASGTTGTATISRGRYLASGEVRGTPRASPLTLVTDGGEVVLDGGTLTLNPEQRHLVMRGRFHLRGTVNLAGATDVHLDGWEFQNPGLTQPAKAVKFTSRAGKPCDGCRVTNSSFSDVWNDFLYVSGAANWAFSGNRGVRQYDMAAEAHFDGIQVAGDSTDATVADNDLEGGVFVSDRAGPVTRLAVRGGMAHKATRAGFQAAHDPLSSMSEVSVDSAFHYGRNLHPGTVISSELAGSVTSEATPSDPLPGHEKDPYRIICGTGTTYSWFASQGTGTSATVGADTGFKSPGMLRLLVVAVPGGTAVTAPDGFTEVGRASDPAGLQLALYGKTISRGDPNVLTVSFSTDVPYAAATATYRYQHPATPWAGVATSAGANLGGPGGTAIATAPSVTPAAPNSLNLRFFAAMGAGSWTPPAGYGRLRNKLGGAEGGIGLLIFDPVFNDYATPGPTGVETAGFSGTGRVAGMTASIAPATVPGG